MCSPPINFVKGAFYTKLYCYSLNDKRSEGHFFDPRGHFIFNQQKNFEVTKKSCYSSWSNIRDSIQTTKNERCALRAPVGQSRIQKHQKLNRKTVSCHVFETEKKYFLLLLLLTVHLTISIASDL